MNVEHKQKRDAMKKEKLELVLLPPKEKKEVTDEAIAKAYIDIISALSGNQS